MAGTPAVPDMRLELVPLPVSDVDRAKAFYEQAGFGNLHDTQVTETMRVVQLTPPGSSCAIVFGTGMGPITDMVPGSVKGLHLVVEDMAATRAALTERGIEPSDVEDMGGVLYSYFSDPDGNMWALQQWPAGYQEPAERKVVSRAGPRSSDQLAIRQPRIIPSPLTSGRAPFRRESR
jgi:predicted enzyme related to lactoylglutathione lyase